MFYLDLGDRTDNVSMDRFKAASFLTDELESDSLFADAQEPTFYSDPAQKHFSKKQPRFTNPNMQLTSILSLMRMSLSMNSLTNL